MTIYFLFTFGFFQKVSCQSVGLANNNTTLRARIKTIMGIRANMAEKSTKNSYLKRHFHNLFNESATFEIQERYRKL